MSSPVRAAGEPQKDYRSYHYSTPCTVAHPHAAKAYDYQCGVCGKRIASASPSDDGARQPQDGLRSLIERLPRYEVAAVDPRRPLGLFLVQEDAGRAMWLKTDTKVVRADDLSAILAAASDDGARQPNDGPPNSTDERLMLNAYGRRCYEAGRAAASDDGAARPQPAQEDTLRAALLDIRNVADTPNAHQDLRDRLNHISDLCSAAISSPSVADSPTWQPIETAPKDGNPVLLWWPDECTRPVVGLFHIRGDGHWYSDIGECDCISEPTHWMPLPSAPSASAAEETNRV